MLKLGMSERPVTREEHDALKLAAMQMHTAMLHLALSVQAVRDGSPDEATRQIDKFLEQSALVTKNHAKA